MENFLDSLSSRLTAAAANKGLSVASIARSLDMKYSSVSAYFQGTNEPKVRVLVKLSELFGVPVQDLINPASEVSAEVEDIDLSSGEFVRIPIRNVDLSAGPGSVPGMEETIGHLAFRADWLRSLSISPDEASLVRVDGTSMSPTLSDNDMVLIDHRRRTLIGKSSIFACRSGTELLVKRIEMDLDDHSIFLHSDNPNEPTKRIPAIETSDFEIIGKVVWSAQTWQDSGY